jgi:hypothetical protein
VDITDACLHGNVLSFVRSARDIDLNTKRKFLHHVIINDKSNKIVSLPAAQLSSEVKFRSVSPSGDKIAIFTTQNNDESVVEIWTNGGTSLRRKIVLPNTLHGDVCTDISWFGSFSWNKEETSLVYSAEMVPPKTQERRREPLKMIPQILLSEKLIQLVMAKDKIGVKSILALVD